MNLPPPDPFAPVVIWQSHDFKTEDLGDSPLYAFQYEDLLDQCQTALLTRQKSYPDLIGKGVIREREAADDIRGWELLTAEWTWICSGEGSLPDHGTLSDRRAAVELALERIGQAFDRGDRRHDLYRQAHLNIALRWHLHRLSGGAPAVHQLVALSRDLRADASAKRRIAA